MNDKLRNIEDKVLSDNWSVLKKITYEYNINGEWKRMEREAYDRGNGAVILLYNRQAKTVVLTRQFRMPTYLNGNADGMLIEACAGLLDKDHPEECIRRETAEETGYEIGAVEKVYEAYMSPGSVTELLYFFIAEYQPDMKLHAGGGLAHEQENIEVMELPFAKALEMVRSGEIKDAKTIMLLQYVQLKGLLQP